MNRRSRSHARAQARRSITRLASSRTYRRWATSIAEKDLPGEDATAILAILLVEMSARPAWFRAIEWAAAAMLRAGILGRWGQERAARMTVGPLQMRAPPFAIGDAVDEAERRISEIDPLDPKTIATWWNGPHADSPTRPLRYSEALKMAIPIARSTQRSMRASRSSTRYGRERSRR